jgi:hypothetical protein
MTDLKNNIHNILKDNLYEYIPAQELTHAANEICKTIDENGNYDEDVMQMMHSYLIEPDKIYYRWQTADTKAIVKNQVALTMHKIRKTIQEFVTANSNQGGISND